MKTIQYRGSTVATNTDLFALIDTGEQEKAKKHYKALDDAFRANWDFSRVSESLLDFHIGPPKKVAPSGPEPDEGDYKLLPEIYHWKGEGPPPYRWTAPDGTIVYRSYADYCMD